MLQQSLFHRHLEEDETLTRIVHRHWLVGLRYLAWPIVSLLISAIFTVLVVSSFVLVVTGLGWIAASILWCTRNFFDYYLDAWLVTDRAVIDLAWHGWFHRQSTRVLYSDIHGVSYEIQGIAGTLLQYGTLSIEKISTGAVISLAEVPHPRDIEADILRNMETYMHAKNMKNAKQVQEILSTFIAEHIQSQETRKTSKTDTEDQPIATAKALKKEAKKVLAKKKAGPAKRKTAKAS